MTARTSEALSKPGPKFRPKPVRKARKRLAPLTEGQAKFLERFLVHHNASRAYREAYPNASPTTAAQAGNELVRHPAIAPQIKRVAAEVARQYAPTKTHTLAEIAALAFSNVQDFYTAEGGLKALADLPRHVTAAVKKVKSKEIEAVDLVTGERKVIGHERELELHDKLGALKMIGQHAGLFAEDDATGAVRDFAQLLREARARIGKPQAPAIEGKAKRED